MVQSEQSHFLSCIYFVSTAIPVTAGNNTREAEPEKDSIQVSFYHLKLLFPTITELLPEGEKYTCDQVFPFRIF